MNMTPQEIVGELDKHVVGQGKAKRAVAIALRNRWRRQQVAEPLRHEITPKNILMIGPTGVGKTEIARRLAKLEQYQGNLLRAAVELAKDWRTDRVLRRLEAMLLVADSESTLVITGNGDVLEPEDGIGAIGSGGTFAQSAAKALQENTDLSPAEVVKKSLTIAAELCIYTNMSHIIETLD